MVKFVLSKSGKVTYASGRQLPDQKYFVGPSRTGKTLQVYNQKGRVVGRVKGANSYLRDNEIREEGKGGAISYHGIVAGTWSEYQMIHLETYGYEYH